MPALNELDPPEPLAGAGYGCGEMTHQNLGVGDVRQGFFVRAGVHQFVVSMARDHLLHVVQFFLRKSVVNDDLHYSLPP
jgi:hypothetical protein